jgi:hypothetical protein
MALRTCAEQIIRAILFIGLVVGMGFLGQNQVNYAQSLLGTTDNKNKGALCAELLASFDLMERMLNCGN